MRGSRILVTLTILTSPCLPVAEAGAQAWIQARDAYYFKVSGGFLNTDEEFDVRGDRRKIGSGDPEITDASFRDVAFTAYVEYGLTEHFTLVTSVPFKISTAKSSPPPAAGDIARRDTRTNGGLGDLRISVRTPLIQTPSALAIQAGVKVPLGYEPEPDNEGPSIGTGEVDGEIRLTFGQSFYPMSSYVSAGFGLRVRGGDLHDELFYDAEAGYTAGPVFAKLRFEGLQNTSSPADVTIEQGIVISSPDARDQDAFKISPEISFRFNESVAVSAEAFHVFAGKNTVAGTTFALGLVYTGR